LKKKNYGEGPLALAFDVLEANESRNEWYTECACIDYLDCDGAK
jgi:hypothetical protein